MDAQKDSNEFDFDFVIVGSGFGGSVSALRLSEKGYKVCVIEQGRRFRSQDYAKSNWDLPRYLWAPFLKCFGIQRLTFFKDVLILSGAGVGGGSLVYANTLMVPSEKAFESPTWRGLGNAREVLAPFYDLAKKMLGAAQRLLKVKRRNSIGREMIRQTNLIDRFNSLGSLTKGVASNRIKFEPTG